LELLVPIHTRPPDTTGLAKEEEPRSACHRMFQAGRVSRPLSRSSTCQRRGAFCSGLTALRVRLRPDWGQSSACSKGGASNNSAESRAAAKGQWEVGFMMCSYA